MISTSQSPPKLYVLRTYMPTHLSRFPPPPPPQFCHWMKSCKAKFAVHYYSVSVTLQSESVLFCLNFTPRSHKKTTYSLKEHIDKLLQVSVRSEREFKKKSRNWHRWDSNLGAQLGRHVKYSYLSITFKPCPTYINIMYMYVNCFLLACIT